jgi:ABC-type sugar transport system substrate-binding protein
MRGPAGILHRWSFPAWELAFFGSFCAVGCDSAAFVPPPPPEVSEIAKPITAFLPPVSDSSPFASKQHTSSAASQDSERLHRERSGGRIVTLVLTHPPDSDHLLLADVLWREAGKARLPFRVVKPNPKEPKFAEQRNEAISAALAGDALIVELDDDPAFIQALYDASARGVAILSIDRPIPPRGDKAYAWITYEPFAETGRQIVDTVLRPTRGSPSASEDRILVLENRTPHRHRAERFASLADALKDAGRSYQKISFEGDDDSARRSLQKALEAGPKVAIILAEEDVGIFAAQAKLVDRLNHNQPGFVIGGYFAYDLRSVDQIHHITVFGDPSIDGFGVTAFQTVRRLLEGKVGPEKTEVLISVHNLSRR